MSAPTALDAIHERLAGVVIERLPWQALLDRYDRPEALFYLDPPYYGVEGYYGPIFKREEYQEMAARLATLKGQFLLSLNDRPEVREIFKTFKIETVHLSYTAQGGSSKRVTEVIISR